MSIYIFQEFFASVDKIITYRFTCGDKKISSNIKKSQSIMAMIVVYTLNLYLDEEMAVNEKIYFCIQSQRASFFMSCGYTCI